MVFNAHHFGLYFNPTSVETFRTNSRREPLSSAATKLQTLTPADPLAAAVVDGMRYRFLGDLDAAQKAAAVLIERGVGLNIPPETPYLDFCAAALAAAHTFEMIRDTLPPDARRGWLVVFGEQIELLRDTPSNFPLLERIWRTAVKIAGAVVLEREDIFVLGVDDFRAIVEKDIHPEGYLPALVERSDGGALMRQVWAAKGLSLAAEAALHAGTDLWNYEVRGISVKTAAIYAAAYYEYGDKWRWDEPPSPDEHEALYQQHGGFLEMLNRQLRPVVLEKTIVKLRPVFDPYGGGMTTLSHAVVKKRGLFGF